MRSKGQGYQLRVGALFRVMAPTHSRIHTLRLPPLLSRWKPQILEMALIIGAYLVYLVTRGLIFSDTGETALQNAERVVSVEKALGFFWEPGWQAWAIDNVEILVTILNWAYIITYWPIIFTLAIVVFLTNRPLYYYFRTVIVTTLVFALVVFLVFPVSSPFDLTAYFVDTIQTFGPSFYASPEMAPYYNTNAAMPSLHFSWTVILAVLLLRTFRGWLKLAGLLYPVVAFFAITITGNHFILDAIAGGLLAAMSFAVVELVGRRHRYLPRLWASSFPP